MEACRHPAWNESNPKTTDSLLDDIGASYWTGPIDNDFDWSYVYNRSEPLRSPDRQRDPLNTDGWDGAVTHDSTTAQFDDYGTLDDSLSLPSEKHIAALISEVNDITQAIQHLQNE